MIKIILEIIQKPSLLTQSTLIKKNFMRKVILLLSLIVSIPIIVTNVTLTQQVKQDFTIISQHLPQFQTVDTIVTGEATHQTNHAIQTDTSYFLYDIENTVAQTTKADLAQSNLFTFMVTKTQYNVFFNAIPVIDLSTASNQISTQFVFDNIQSLTQVLSIAMWLSPLLSILSAIIMIYFYNVFFTVSARFIFLMQNKIVHWVHLWRVSVFASIVPYITLTLLSLFNINVPYEFLIILVYTLIIQHQVLKSATQ